jgi:toxin ParE2
MKIRILAPAEFDLVVAVDFYNTQYPGLGYKFTKAVEEGLDRISSFPEAWPAFSNNTRRCLLKRFPYGILYQHRKNEIIVFAVMHLKRNPENWQKRISL